MSKRVETNCAYVLLNNTAVRLTTPLPPKPWLPTQTFLELIKLYKSVLSRKRKETQEAIDRLENGLSKLHKTKVKVWCCCWLCPICGLV